MVELLSDTYNCFKHKKSRSHARHVAFLVPHEMFTTISEKVLVASLLQQAIAVPIIPAWIHPERGRDECCPYRRVLSLCKGNEPHPL
jgi:hypothetical protein